MLSRFLCRGSTRWRARAAIAVLGLPVMVLAGCAAYPTAPELAGAPFTLPPEVVLDSRARFREVFCALAQRDGESPIGDPRCETLLWRLEGEPAASEAGKPLPAIDPTLRFFLVTGALSDCFGPDALPYREGVERLASEGVMVRTIRVSGRSSTRHNARQVAGVLAAATGPAERVVLIGYSKGAVDILQLLDDFPDLAPRVAAVVSVAGPILGSPLAEQGAWAYDHLLAHAFGGRCDPGDGGLVDSLLPAVRREWLAGHPLPGHVASFSLGAFTTHEHLARSLRPSWRLLAGDDPRNDGQVLAGDAVIPGSTLLGFANSDHWGLAIAIDNELPHLAARPAGSPLPRRVLLEAILRQVSEALAGDGGER